MLCWLYSYGGEGAESGKHMCTRECMWSVQMHDKLHCQKLEHPAMTTTLSWFVALVVQRVFRSADDRIVQSRERVLMVGGDVTRRAIKSNPRICLKPGAGLPILLDLRVWLALHA